MMSHNITEAEKINLLNHAKIAMERAYTPYSNFKVGAALLDESGNIYYGCNIENAAYGPTNCAERTAFFSALAQGVKPRTFKLLAVIGDTPEPIAPCGVCRQVIVELLSEDTPIILGNLQGNWRETTSMELLPHAFVPSALLKEDTQ